MTPGIRAARSLRAMRSIQASLQKLAAGMDIELKSPRSHRDPLVAALFKQEWAAGILEKIAAQPPASSSSKKVEALNAALEGGNATIDALTAQVKELEKAAPERKTGKKK